MRALVLGAGAKDHAIIWWFSKSSLITSLYVAPGNFCTKDYAVNLPEVNPANPDTVMEAVKRYNIDFVFIGTEAPLLTGVVKRLQQNGILAFGATQAALKLDDDKAFSRAFMGRHGIPTPENQIFSEIKALKKYLNQHEGTELVIKTNTMSPSRVMMLSSDYDALLAFAKKLITNGPIIVEKRKRGIPITVTIIMDNNGYLMLPITGEYTKVSKTNDTPTGGMGAVCPVPAKDSIKKSIIDKIIAPTLKGLKEEGLTYCGILTLSIVIDKALNPFLVDYHVRLNDPATQAMVPIIETDIAQIITAALQNRVSSIHLQCNDDCTVAVVLASEGYPMEPKIGKRLDGLTNSFLMPIRGKPIVFCGAVEERENGDIITSGGRNITVVGRGKNIEEANRMAYRAIKNKGFKDLWYREDIGNNYFKSPSYISGPDITE